MADHYAVLGLTPYAEHSAVRAAYLELMRRYHPDINASPEAAARAREVTVAYEVLGDPDSRIDYDLSRANAQAAMAQAKSPGISPPHTVAAVAVLAAAGLSAILLIPSPRERGSEQAGAVTTPSASPQPEHRKVAQPSPSRQTSAPARPLPAAAAPQPVKIAPRPAALTIAPSPPLAPTERPAPRVAAAPPQRALVAEKSKAAPAGADLAGMDRHLGILFRQSVSRANAAKQQSLYRDHYRFIARLNACSTAACKQREYLGRMGEVSNTMAASAKPR